MRPDVGPGDALGELRHLLFGGEAQRLGDVETELRRLAVAKLDRADLLAATAEVLAGALRRAEVDRHRELADALAPLIVAAIQAEIRNSKDSMVEALYPLMGRLVSAAVANSIRQLSEDLARRIDALVSARMWKWRLQSIATGKPIGEIALADSQRARVVRVLCLERHSGTPIAVWPDAEDDARSDLVSGLIAAITEFAATTFARGGGELRALDLGSQHVLLRSSATVIVAAECEGVLHQEDEQRVDAAFLALIGRHERGGRIDAAELAALGGALKREELDRPSAAGRWVVRALAAAAAAAAIWWIGSAALDWRRERQIEAALRNELAALPQAQAYPLRLDVDHRQRRVLLSGLLPEAALEGRLASALSAAAAPYALATKLDVVAGQAASADRAQRVETAIAAAQDRLAALGGELDRLRADAEARAAAASAASAEAAQRVQSLASAAASAQRDGASAAEAQKQEAAQALAALRADVQAVERAAADAAQAARQSTAEAIAAARSGLQADLAALKTAGLSPVERLREAAARTAIFFSRGPELADRNAALATAERLAQLVKDAGVGLRVVGHTDDTGSADLNAKLSRERAEIVARLLTEKGAPAQLLVTASRRAAVPISDVATVASSPNRRVTFELLLDQEPLQ